MKQFIIVAISLVLLLTASCGSKSQPDRQVTVTRVRTDVPVNLYQTDSIKSAPQELTSSERMDIDVVYGGRAKIIQDADGLKLLFDANQYPQFNPFTLAIDDSTELEISNSYLVIYQGKCRYIPYTILETVLDKEGQAIADDSRKVTLYLEE